jgi:hypothetical protein
MAEVINWCKDGLHEKVGGRVLLWQT